MSAAVSSERVRVLVPLDGSVFSHQVIPYVTGLLRPDTHALTVLRVAPVPEGYASIPPRPMAVDTWTSAGDLRGEEPPVYYSQVYEGAVANLEDELLNSARQLNSAGFDVTPEVRFGDPASEIVAVVDEGGFDLVVMATHGRSGVVRLLLGSVAGEVLKRVHVPVMMVRPVPEGAGERVGVPSRGAHATGGGLS